MDLQSRIKTGRQHRPQRNVFYGVEGIGKSSLAAQFPNPITLAAEDGVAHINTSSATPTDWNDALQLLSQLYNEEHGFKTLNIDTAGWIEEMCCQFLIVKHKATSLETIDKGYGKWKRYLLEEWKALLNWLTALYGKGMNINIIAHAKVAKFKNPEDIDYDRYSISMNHIDLAEQMKQWADNVIFMNYDTLIDEEKDGMSKKKIAKSMNRRIAYCQRTAAFDAKQRHGLPPSFDLGRTPEEGYTVFQQHYAKWLADSGLIQSSGVTAQEEPVAVNQ